MKVNSPLRWRIVELLSWLQCWTGDLASRVGRWFVCVFAHRQSWRRQHVYRRYSWECAACGRRWTTPD
jgi:hypothetical protein